MRQKFWKITEASGDFVRLNRDITFLIFNNRRKNMSNIWAVFLQRLPISPNRAVPLPARKEMFVKIGFTFASVPDCETEFGS